MDFKKFLRQDLSVIKDKLTLEILKQKTSSGETILYELFHSELPVVKYFFEFCKEHSHESLLEKNNIWETILHRLVEYSISLPTVKYVFKFYKENYPNYFLEKTFESETILHYLTKFNTSLSVVKYVFKFYKENYPNYFLEKDFLGTSILYSVFRIHAKCLPVIKYVFNFHKKHFPSLFLEKTNFAGNNILHSMSLSCEISPLSINFIINFLIKFYPYLFLIEDRRGRNILRFLSCRYDFHSISKEIAILVYNFPEISRYTNNFILPLLIEIQN